MGNETFGGSGNGDDEGKKADVIRFPNRAARVGTPAGLHRAGTATPRTPEAPAENEGGFAEIAEDLKNELEAEIANRPELGITQAEVDAKEELLLREAGDGTKNLEEILEASVGDENVSEDRAKTVLYLAAALAYLNITDLAQEEGEVEEFPPIKEDY